jgi:hypothetical protein
MVRAPKTNRPQNREIENETIRPPEREGQPPRSATAPPKPSKKRASSRPHKERETKNPLPDDYLDEAPTSTNE